MIDEWVHREGDLDNFLDEYCGGLWDDNSPIYNNCCDRHSNFTDEYSVDMATQHLLMLEKRRENKH